MSELWPVFCPCDRRGLLGGHSLALMLKEKGEYMQWYSGELLHMATQLGYKLLPAFNTTSGLPYPRVSDCKFGCLPGRVFGVNMCPRRGTDAPEPYRFEQRETRFLFLCLYWLAGFCCSAGRGLGAELWQEVQVQL